MPPSASFPGAPGLPLGPFGPGFPGGPAGASGQSKHQSCITLYSNFLYFRINLAKKFKKILTICGCAGGI